MNTNLSILNKQNNFRPSFQAKQKHTNDNQAQAQQIEAAYEDFISNLYEIAQKNGMSASDIARQIRNAQAHKNAELGKLDILG